MNPIEVKDAAGNVIGYNVNGQFIAVGPQGTMGGTGGAAGLDPYGLGGARGYNPFQSGAYSSYFGGGMGMPPQASGFRYRNERNQQQAGLDQYANQLKANQKALKELSGNTDQASLDQIKALEGESAGLQNKSADAAKTLNTLKSARMSYMGNAVAGAAPGIISGAIGYFDKQDALNKLRALNPDEFVPEEMKQATSQARLGAASARTADDAFRRKQLGLSEATAAQTAALAATSPDQVQNAAIRAQQVKNQGIQQLGAEGVAGQSQRKQYANQLASQQGQMRAKVRDQIQSQIDATKQNQMKDIYGTLGTIGQAAVTAGV